MARFSRIQKSLLVLLACCLALILPAPAFAERRDADVICGSSQAQLARADADRPDITASAAIVVGKDGETYFERDADKQVKIASVTKVMTAILALENTQLTDTVTVSASAAAVGQASAGLEAGDTLTMESLLRGLLVSSGNDAAQAIAEHVGAKLDPASPDPASVFVKAMNDKAAALGMTSTVFENAHGLDFDEWAGGMHSTARDVSKMFAHAMTVDAFRALVADPGTEIQVTGSDGTVRTVALKPHNDVLGRDGNIGGKTGTTPEAGECFVGAFSQDAGGEVYTVVLGSAEGKRFDDTLALSTWYYAHTVSYPVVSATRETAAGAPLVGRAVHADWTDKTVDVTVSDADANAKVSLFSLAGEVTDDVELKKLSGDVRRGDAAGTLTISQGGAVKATVTLVTAQGQDAPQGLDWLMVKLDRFIRDVEGRPQTAKAAEYVEPVDPTSLDAAA